MKLNATFQHQASYSNRKKIIEHDRYHHILYSIRPGNIPLIPWFSETKPLVTFYFLKK